jgi:CubicO group peptidase (beta-lactamase class C family)
VSAHEPAPEPGRLDWPVAHGGTAVVTPERVELAVVPGTDPEAAFEVASVTKLLTTLAALAAVQQGRLALDQDLGDHELPEVTVRHLLAHASGLPFEEGTSRRPPGTRRIYSNLGFRLLGEVVADAVGLDFDNWLQTAVLDPLGMAATSLTARRWSQSDPAAGAVATLGDLVKLARCLLTRGAPLLGEDLFAEAASVQFPGLAGLLPGIGRFNPCDWGLGFELKDGKRPHWMGERRSPASFGHFGASGCFLWVDPDVPVAAAAVTDRTFDDDKWAMAVWPQWSDSVSAAV